MAQFDNVDHLGFIREPIEREPVLYDWRNQPIYEQEQYRIINGEIVADEIDEIREFLDYSGMEMHIA